MAHGRGWASVRVRRALSLLVIAFATLIGSPAGADVGLPPQELLSTMIRESRAGVRVAVDAAEVVSRDGGYLKYAVRGVVTKRYKGPLKAGDPITFTARAESGTEDLSSPDRIVFLGRGRDGSWHALEFGLYRYDSRIEASIRSLATRSEGPRGK